MRRPILFAFRCCAILVFLAKSAVFCCAQDEKWSTGVEFETAWENPLSLTWEGNPLRPAISRLARQSRVAILLDRRLDPEQRLTLTIANEPLSLALQRIAAKVNAGVCRVGPVAYIGPNYLTDRLATVASLRRADIERLNPTRRSGLLSPKTLQWEELAEPRALVTALANEARFEPTELTKNVPHDLWPANRLPALAWADRLSLVLAGFDLTFELDEANNALRFVPLPASPLAVKTLSVRGSPTKVAAELAAKFPQVETRVVGAKLAVRGRWEDLEIVERLLRGERVERATVVPGPSNFSLEVAEQPAGVVVRHIAKQLMYTLDVAPGAEELLEKRVSFQADRLTLADLLRTVLRGTGLKAEIEGQRIRVLKTE